MPKIDRFDEHSGWIDVGFVGKTETPKPLMKLGIELHLAGVSLSNTVSFLEKFGVGRARSTAHNWLKKADLQPGRGRSPELVAVDETVIWLNGRRFWLFASVDPNAN